MRRAILTAILAIGITAYGTQDEPQTVELRSCAVDVAIVLVLD